MVASCAGHGAAGGSAVSWAHATPPQVHSRNDPATLPGPSDRYNCELRFNWQAWVCVLAAATAR